MERDFMGLAVKQEISDEAIDAAPLRSSPMQWSFSNKASALPQLLPFQGAQEERAKTGFDSLASAGLVTITTTEAFNSDHKSYSGLLQNNIVSKKQGGVGYTVTNYPTQHVNGHAIHHQFSSQTNLTVSPTVGCAVHQSIVAAAGQNVIGSVGPQPLAGVSMANPVPTTSSSPVVGTTDLRNPSKISGAPAQLTIFYNGSVCVFDNISPEKAQAIMLLAGNGPPVSSSPTVPAAPVQASMPRSSFLDGFVVSQPYGTTPRRSSPTSVTSISVSQSGGWPRTFSDMNASKQRGILVSPNKVEHIKVVNLSGSVSATYLPSGTVPQFRRKSLARFLEKRKERVINIWPYANSATEAGSTSLSVNSSGSCPVPPIN